MARDWKTTHAASSSSATHTVTFPQAAVAGRGLIAFGTAPASVDPSSAGWVELGEATDPLLGDLSVSRLVSAAGGETSLTWVREPAAGTAPRTFAGWVESRDDLGAVHAGTWAAYGNPSGTTSIDLAPVVTTVPDCRIYVAVCTVNDGTTWTPVISGFTLEDIVQGPALGAEPVRLAVLTAVVAAGSHAISITGVPINPAMITVLAIEPADLEPPPDPVSIIEEENRLVGVDKTTWDVSGGPDTTIHGWSDMAVPVGGTLQLRVHSPSSAWTGRVYRLGYYGSRGAREIATVSGAQTTQPSGTTDGTTGMVDCGNWSVNGSWAVPADAVPGVHVIKIWRTNLTSAVSHIGPFVVHDPARKASVLIKVSESTWAGAYNHASANPADIFAGKNLYGQGTTGSFIADAAQRCKAVSLRRTIVTRRSYPQTHFMNAEYPLLRFVERLGWDVDYATSAMVDADPTLLLGRDAVISSGHDEYWSAAMFDAFTAARDSLAAPSHLVFLSGNEAFWHIRWNAGRTAFDCWKDSLDGALNASGLYSGTWQDTRGFNSDRRPAALLVGQRFRHNAFANLPLIATAAHAASPFWRSTAVAALTGPATWTSPVGLVGFEADEPADTSATEKPAGLIRLSQATSNVTGMLADDNGAVYSLSGSYTHSITAYRDPESGAAVFGFGSCQIAWGLDDVHDRHPGGSLVSQPIQQAITNLLVDLGATPSEYALEGVTGLVMPTPVALSTYGLPDPSDSTAPTAPTGLQVTAAQTSIALTWSAATDNIGVTGYDLYRDGVLVASAVAGLTYNFTGLLPGSVYTLGVRSRDAAGNSSTMASLETATLAASNTVLLITLTEYAAALGVDVDDLDIGKAQFDIAAASSWVESVTGHAFTVRTSTIRLPAVAVQELHLPVQPVRAVSAASIGGATVTDYTVTLDGVWRSAGWRSSYAPQILQFTVQYGLTSPPPNIKALVREVSVLLAEGAVTAESIDDYRVQYASGGGLSVTAEQTLAAYGAGVAVVSTWGYP